MPKMNNQFVPLRLVENEDSFNLYLDEFDQCAEVFEEMDYDGGGYGWHGVADAIIRLNAPHLAGKIEFDPEASLFVAYGPDRAAIEELARLLKSAIDDETLLRTAIENADPELMD